MLVYKCRDSLRLLDGIALRIGEVLIRPFDGVLVVRPYRRRIKAHTLVSGLHDVVEARIVHDGGRRTVCSGEGRRAQRVDGVSRRGRHVVHEAKSMADLVGDDVLQRLGHEAIG